METLQFGQKQPIHIAIRGLIRDYPQDEGILKELVQNADDGGASEVSFILDRTRYPQSDGPVRDWQRFAQPALLVINDQPFSPEDLENIQDLGDSDKVTRPNQTGRYGRGFNSVYNLTDTPLLLTGSTVCIFDPCGFQVDSPGGAWKLSNQEWEEQFEGALNIFKPGGYKSRADVHEGTIFRFPFRTQLSGEESKDRITDELFPAESFYRLVDGLAKIADIILLHLRHVTSIRCFEIGPGGGKAVPLLEITTENPDEVRRARLAAAAPFEGLENIAEILERLEALPQSSVQSAYDHRVRVARPGNPERTCRWTVCSGMYAGSDNRLTTLAGDLNRAGNKAVPSAGAAICVELNGKFLPGLEGGVSCSLPLAGVLGGTSLPLSINGAFDLDGSRTGITKHSGGEVGQRELRAEWNVALIEDGVVPAIVEAMVRVPLEDQESVRRFYRLLTSMKEVTAEPFGSLPRLLFQAIAKCPVFRNAHGTAVPLDELRAVPDDPCLQAALSMEGLPIPCPPLPPSLVQNFSLAGIELENLDSEAVREAFHREESVEWAPEHIEIPSLRQEGHVEAVVRFLVELGCEDFSGLPLAWCEDGVLRTFPGPEEAPLFIGSRRQKDIFNWFPQWFLDDSFCLTTGLVASRATGFGQMGLADVGRNLHRMVFDEDGESWWSPDGEESPNTAWLILVMDEVMSDGISLGDAQTKEVLLSAPLIPGDDGYLHRGGLTETPLLVQNTESSLAELLATLGIRHWILRPGQLTERLVKLRDTETFVWSLTPDDLVDSLGGCIEELVGGKGQWRSKKTVERLLDFIGRRDLSLNESRKDALCRLPIWLDGDGVYGPVDDHCYFAGDFQSQGCSAGFRVLRKETQGKILSQLGIGEITRREILERYVLTEMGELEDDAFVRVVRWIRAEWDRLADEFESGEEELVAILKTRALVIDSEGERRLVPELYTTESAELAAGVLGDTVRTPSREFYTTETGQWGRFFDALGILKSPSAQHLTRYIEGVVNGSGGRRATPSEEQSLIAMLKHVRATFDVLAEQTVESEQWGEVAFADFLADTAWVPAFRPADAVARFGAWKEPEARLFQPKELVHYSLGARIASVRPLSPTNVYEFPLEARQRLGIVRLPSPEESCTHLRNIVERVDAEMLGDATFTAIEKPIEEVYRGLGELERDGEKLGYTTEELVGACQGVSSLPCILHPVQKRLMRPRDVYEGETNGMSPLKVSLRGGTPEMERGLNLLGRRERPGIDDLAATLRELAEDGRDFRDEELSALLVCVNRLIRLIDDVALDDLPELCLPNAEGTLKAPEDLVWDDDPALSQQLDLPKEWLLHPEVTGIAGRVLGLATLSAARAVPTGELVVSQDRGFLSECDRLERLLRSEEFLEGISRLLLQDGRHYRSEELAWLEDVRVSANRQVTCSYLIERQFGRPLDLGSAEAEVAFVDFSGRCEFLISEEAQHEGLLLDHFGREFQRQLADLAPSKEGSVFRLLRAEPGDIASILDRLHVPRKSARSASEEADDEVTVIGSAEQPNDGSDEIPPDLKEDASDTPPENSAGSDEPRDEGTDEGDTDGEDNSGLQSGGESSDGRVPRPGSGENPPGARVNGGGESSGGRRRNPLTIPPGLGGSGSSGNGGSRSGGSRGRMLKGEGGSDGARQLGTTRNRQQDGLWISRPKTDSQAKEAEDEGDSQDDETSENLAIAIGDAAVGWVLQYELQQGRSPMGMHQFNPGYDVESRLGLSPQPERFIEVKGIDGEWGQNGVPLSGRQFEFAREKGDGFWLYVVEHARDPERVRIHAIQNPFGKVTQFRFDHGWREASWTAKEFRPLVPAAGARMRKVLDEKRFEEGEILSVEGSGKCLMLEVRFDTGGPARRFTYDPTSHLILE
jgi:hypothetical protein